MYLVSEKSWIVLRGVGGSAENLAFQFFGVLRTAKNADLTHSGLCGLSQGVEKCDLDPGGSALEGFLNEIVLNLELFLIKPRFRD